MALTSPGVEVTIIDQSQYLPAATGSVPLVVFATAQNKANPTGTGVAQGTTAANAGKLFQITSQRDLVTTYGNPFFYTTTNGTPIQGYELNEYGLLAAYSLLGATNRCYCLRADIDLSALVGRTGRPSGDPTNGSWWVDTATTDYGIYEWNAITQKFVKKVPLIITNSTDMTGNFPKQSIGNIGDYAVYTLPVTSAPTLASQKVYFLKMTTNSWTVVGSNDWIKNWPTVTSTATTPTLVSGTFTINMSGQFTFTVTINPGDTVVTVANAINALGYSTLTASVLNGKLNLFSAQTGVSTVPRYITIAPGTGGTAVLTALGIPAGTYYEPEVVYGTSAQLPLWGALQATPHPTGSVWLKVGASGLGFDPTISVYSSTTDRWTAKNVTLATDPASAIYALDPTGGLNIPVDTVFCQYEYWKDININNTYYISGFSDPGQSSPQYFYQRQATGPTKATGTNTSPSFTNGPYRFEVIVSNPNSATLSGYQVSLADNTNAIDFCTAWSGANIQFTTATVNSDGAIEISHTLGGEIIINDAIRTTAINGSITGNVMTVTSFTGSGVFVNSVLWNTGITAGTTITSQLTGSPNGPGTYEISETLGSPLSLTGALAYPPNHTQSSGLVAEIGLTPNVSGSVINGPGMSYIYLVNGSTVAPGTGTNSVFQVVKTYGNYFPVATPIQPGTGYSVGDLITISGTSLGGASPANDLVVKVTGVNGANGITSITYISGSGISSSTVEISNWKLITYTPNEIAPVAEPANNTLWYYSVTNEVDIMVNYNGQWYGYRNRGYDVNGFPNASANSTDPNGPIISASAPTVQSDDSPLVYGDIWIDTSDLENYPLISRWQQVDGVDKWVLIDNTDQVNPTGVVFTDARWGTSGAVDPVNDAIPTIKSLLSSNYLDLDAPSPSLYPSGMLLFNTRRSGYNVKQFKVDYFNANSFPDETLPAQTDAWVSVSGLQTNGSPYMGRKAQRAMVVQGLRAAIDTNTDIRDEDNFFNLISSPNYPELQPNMVVLNTDRGETAYIIGDTPLGLADNATAIQAWATNAAGASSTGEQGCVTRNTYLGLFYPSGLAADLSGNEVVVPPSHMMLRTFLRNDTIAYPWLAAAGTRRGIIDNALNIGYLDRDQGEFIPTKTRLGIRDTLYTNFINPLVFFTGNGLLNYGNKTSFNSQSALDRTNVARLVAYIRRQLTIAARPFVFEPNDALTRQQIAGVIESLMIDLVAKRGIYDYLVVCDESNNTPDRIDRNELWVDVAIEPVKAAEFIYVPVRILNTGEISGV